MSSRLANLACGLLVTVIALVHFVMGRGEPQLPFWDENYYITSAQRYLDGTAQFAAHPPLGLMLIAAGEGMLRDNKTLDLSRTGAEKHIKGELLPPGFSFRGLRLMPSLFAAAGAMVFFCLLLTLTGQRVTALAFSCLYLQENAFMAHLPAVHLDAFQVFFILCALWCAVSSVQQSRTQGPWLDLLFGLSVGLATMVKLNSLVFGVTGLWLLWRRVRVAETTGAGPIRWRRGVAAGGAMTLGFALAVVAVMSTHTALAHHPPDQATEAGRKDAPFVSGAHLRYLQGQRHLSPQVIGEASLDYLRFLAADYKGMPKGQRSDSMALLWPVHDMPVNYRRDTQQGQTRYVQLAGNLFNWGIGLSALVLCGATVLSRRVLRQCAGPSNEGHAVMEVLLLTYLSYMAAHVWIGQQRIMYLHHYFPALILTYIMAPMAWAMWVEARAWSNRAAQLTLLTMALASAASSAFIWPLTRHEPLTRQACELRNIAIKLVDCQG